MPTATSSNPHAGSAEASNQYEQEIDDFLRDLPLDNSASNNANITNSPAKNVDEEIKIRKKRAPAPKLDEKLLLSDNGITRLRRITKTKLKIKGKGHEFSDMARMLNMYQLWLDDMYPKAKFRDALTMVEKLGHTKRMQVTRRGWLDGAESGRREEEVERVGDGEVDVEMSGGLGGLPDRASNDDLFGESEDAQPGGGRRQEPTADHEVPDADELDDLMAENERPAVKSRLVPTRTAMFEEDDDDIPDADDLDALLNEQPTSTSAPKPTAQQYKSRRPFQEVEENGSDVDDLDALFAEQADPNAGKQLEANGLRPSRAAVDTQDDFDDDEEALASMGGMW